MSISPSNIYMALDIIKLFSDPTKIQMLELGNQKLRDVEDKVELAKEYFSNLGIQHTSFDINNKDGAIKVDLCKPLDKKYIERFDIVTDFGTIEHIENQPQVFCNVHDACKVGGYMIHSLPLEKYWNGHCPYHYQEIFPNNLAKKNAYELIFQEIKPRRKEKFINFIYKRTNNNSFIFTTDGLLYTKNYKHNEDNLF